MFILSKHCGSVIFHPLHVTILVATLWGFITLPLLGLLSWRQLAILPPLWCLTKLRFVILTSVGLAPAFFCNLDFWGLFLVELECRDFSASVTSAVVDLWQPTLTKTNEWGQFWTNYINNIFSQFWLILWLVLDESLSQSKVMGILKRPLCLMATMRSG